MHNLLNAYGVSITRKFYTAFVKKIADFFRVILLNSDGNPFEAIMDLKFPILKTNSYNTIKEQIKLKKYF